MSYLLRQFAIALMASHLFAAPASAASVTNRDVREHTLEVISGNEGASRLLKPNEAWSDVCPKGCVVRLDADEITTYELQGSDVVSIEDGFIYYDRDDAPSPAAPALTPQPPAK